MNVKTFKQIAIASLVFGIIGIVSTESATAQSSNPYKPSVGEVHPDFSLPSIADRKPIKLSEFRGKKMLLFHFASW